MQSNKCLIITWLALLFCTLLSVLIAETSSINHFTGVFVCFIISLKGQLVIDHLIGLRVANIAIRRVMLSYFYILPLLIALGIVAPNIIVGMTSLG